MNYYESTGIRIWIKARKNSLGRPSDPGSILSDVFIWWLFETGSQDHWNRWLLPTALYLSQSFPSEPKLYCPSSARHLCLHNNADAITIVVSYLTVIAFDAKVISVGYLSIWEKKFHVNIQVVFLHLQSWIDNWGVTVLLFGTGWSG